VLLLWPATRNHPTRDARVKNKLFVVIRPVRVSFRERSGGDYVCSWPRTGGRVISIPSCVSNVSG